MKIVVIFFLILYFFWGKFRVNVDNLQKIETRSFSIFFLYKLSWHRSTSVWLLTRLVEVSISTWENTLTPERRNGNINFNRKYFYLNLYFHFFALVPRQSAALSFATQRSVLVLGSLFLPCCVRATAWSWYIFYRQFF